MKKYALLLGTIFLVQGSLLMAAEDFQIWNQFAKNVYTKGDFNLQFYMEARFDNDAADAQGFFFGPIFSYRINKTLSVGGGAKMIHFKSGEHFARLQRYEGEFKLDFKQFSKVKIQSRNRYEYIRSEQGENSSRIRLRVGFTVPLKKGPLTKVYCDNEYFANEWFESTQRNRITPLGLGFKLDKKRSLNVFYRIEYRHGRDQTNHILGTFLTF